MNIKHIDYRHYILSIFIIISIVFAIWYFKYADNRIIESCIDLKNSSIYYFNNLFNLDKHGVITINKFSEVPFVLPFNLPNNWEDFVLLWKDYWALIITKDNFIKYLHSVGELIYYFSKVLLIVCPVFLIVVVSKMLSNDEVDNNYNEDTKALKTWKKLEKKVYLPIKEWLISFKDFFMTNDIYWRLLIIIWAYNFNAIAIGIESIAYYLYFVCSFNTTSLYIQVLKLFFDLSVVINFFHSFIWFIFMIMIINHICKKIGINKLNHMEFKDRGFINERPIVIMLNGTMGSKKTTMITDIALSQEIMFRNVAFEKILKCDLMFPYFPWINLENNLKKAIENHSVYNLATCKRYARSKRLKYEKDSSRRNIYMYDFKRYGMHYNDKLKVNYIWDVIENYVQLYFVYIIQSSLLISNYSIRTDNVLNDIGNFPLWDCDLFSRDTSMMDAYSRHAHILDFDMLRLGKKVIEDNYKQDCFEFGVINITEIGKERKNAVELMEVKKKDESANQKNDLFNTWLKMVRHSATIDNYPFVKVICDDQRPESWGADARDLCEIVFIDKCSEMRVTRPLFGIYDFFCNIFINSFNNRYYDYRYKHGSNSLSMYLYHGLISSISKYQQRNYNMFGYHKLDTIIESGRQDGKTKENNYYLMYKKIYSKRFSTDCFSDFFNEKALRSSIGINDLNEFETIKASFEEMLSENSYFFNDLNRLRKK